MYPAFRILLFFSPACALIFAPPLGFGEQPPRLTAYLVDRAPAVDGKLDDAVWNDAPESDPFVIYGSGEKPEYETWAKIVYDREALYLGIRCEEPTAERIIHSFVPSDPGSWRGDDTIEVFIDPLATHSHFYQFIFNADGPTVSGYDNDFQNPLPHEGAGLIGSGFWSLEIRVPFSTLRYTPTPGDFWAMNICRTRQAKGEEDKRELSAWSKTPGGFQRPSNFGTLVFGAAPALGQAEQQPDTSATDRVMARIHSEWEVHSRWGPEDLTETARLNREERLLRLARFLARYPRDVVWYVREPITDVHVYPWTVPEPEEIGHPIRIRACRGEYEPATFVVFTLDDLTRLEINFRVHAGNMYGKSPMELPDAREVKCWYQSGAATMRPDKTTLLPELLLHDPSIVTVDPKERKNTFNFSDYPLDAQELQPTSIPAFESRQFWVTVHIPTDAKPGMYRGAFHLLEKGYLVAQVPVEIEVLDFDLEPSPMIHSLYYTRRLHSDRGEESLHQQMAMMEGEIKNQVEHGINAPSTYVHNGSLPWTDTAGGIWDWLIKVHREAGVPEDAPFLHVSYAVGTQQEEEQLERIRQAVRKSAAFLKERGRPNLYVQGKDEAPPDILRQERKSFQAVNDAGGKVFVACGSDYFDAAGDLLNLPVVGGRLRKDLAQKVHEQGHKILVYANPWGGLERPEIYRRNYGIRLWLADYDGVMNWQYADTGTDAWDDFKGKSRRYNMAYPALKRPVDTIEWEGFREGVDDLRYLFTLLKYLEEAERTGDRAELTGEIREWLNSVEGTEDLDEVRDTMIRWIQELRSQQRG